MIFHWLFNSTLAASKRLTNLDLCLMPKAKGKAVIFLHFLKGSCGFRIGKKFGPQRHKTFEYSQENSQLKYPSPRVGELKIS
jgi:hypothetical protein